MWNYIDYNELYHHGIPGMKWGIRKVRDAIGGKVRGSRTLGQIARKTGYYTPSAAKRAFTRKFTNPYSRTGAAINIARAVPKSPILGNRIKSKYGARIVHKYLNQHGGVFIGVVSGQMSKPQRIMGYNRFKQYRDQPLPYRFGYSIKLDNMRREALMPPSHGNMFRRLR